MKPRSGLVTDGLERAPARGMLRAVGMGDEDWVKPQIGIASSWNEITPCNLSLDRLAKASRKGIIDAGGFPMQFGTISVSDGISMGHEGMHFSLVSREVIADSVETVMQAERLDGMVTFAGCDKSLPGMMMAAARLDVASVFVYAGSTLPGQVDGKDVTIIDAFEAVGACARGLITQDRVDQIEKAICPGEGACGGMFTANTMASIAEAIGLALPGSAAPPAVDRRRDKFAEQSGEAKAILEQKIRNLSSFKIFRNYLNYMDPDFNSDSPLISYKNHTQRIIKITKVELTGNPFRPDAAEVAFQAEERGVFGESVSTWKAEVDFNMSDIEKIFKKQSRLSFVVTRYNTYKQ